MQRGRVGFEAGAATGQSALPAAREQIAQLQETIELHANQLAALLGKGPDRVNQSNVPAGQSLAAVAIRARSRPSWLGRRPDIWRSAGGFKPRSTASTTPRAVLSEREPERICRFPDA